MKINQKEVEKFLKTLGIQDVEVVEGDSDKDLNTDEWIAQVDASRKSVLEPQIKDGFKTELESGLKARMFGTVKSAFSRSGIKLTEDYETIDQMVKDALKGYNDKFSQDTESLREEIAKLVADHATNVSELTNKYEGQIKSEKDRFIDRDVEEIIQGKLKKIPRIGGDEITQAKQAKQWLRENYHVNYDLNDRKIDITDKNNPEKPVYNESKTKLREVDDLLQEWCDKMGIAAKDTRHQKPEHVMHQSTDKNLPKLVDDNDNAMGNNPLDSNDAQIKVLLG